MRAKPSSSRGKTRAAPPRASTIIAVVDITSSPEPEAFMGAPIPAAPRPRPRRPKPRSAPPDESTGTSSSNSSTPEGRPNARSDTKGKGRAQPIAVIELTDSSDDDGGEVSEEEVEERVIIPRRVTRSSSRQAQQPPAPTPTPSKGKTKSKPTVQAKGKAKAATQYALSPVTENHRAPSPTLADDDDEEEHSDAGDQGYHAHQLLFLDGSSDVEDVPLPPGSSTMTSRTTGPAGIARTPSIEEAVVVHGAASSSRRPAGADVDQPPIMALPVALAVDPPPRVAMGTQGQANPSTQPAQGHTGGRVNMDGIKAGGRGGNVGDFDVSDDDVDYGAYLDVLQGNFMDIDGDEGGARPFGDDGWLLEGPALEAPVQAPVWQPQEGGDDAVARDMERQLEGVQVPEHLILENQEEVEEKEDPLTGATRSILEMIPDIDYDFLCALVAEHLPTYGTNQVVEFVINHLFGEGSKYPRAAKGSKGADGGKEGKRKVGEGDVEEVEAGGGARKKVRLSLEGDGAGKGKARDHEGMDQDEGEAGVERHRQDGGQDHKAEDQEDLPDPNNYLTPNPTHLVPPGRDYQPLSLSALQQEFGKSLGKHRAAITAEGGYARAWLALWNEHEASKDGSSPIAPSNKGGAHHKRKTKAKGKGKQRALFDEAFERESAFVNGLRASLERKRCARLQRERQERIEGPAAAAGLDGDAVMALELESAPAGANPDSAEGDGEDEVECQCCFGGYPFFGMAQCPEGHLFCEECFRRNVEGLVGSQNPVIRCMSSDGDGCLLQFAESEMKRMLEGKLFMLYEKVKQQKELKEAQIEGLEECPFCDWACVIEVEKDVDKLFRCNGCGEVSCRECKKKEHLPKSCQEMEEDKHLDKRILIEEAMTKALMRNCPKCKKAFLKESGCNKMTCPECHTLSCYVCKKAITGYDHFHQNNPGVAGGSSSNNKCPLWDSVDHRHDDEVNKAYKAAVEQVQKEHPEIDMGKDIKVDLPAPPPPQPQYPAGYVHAGMFGGGPVYAPIPAVPHNINPAVARGQLQQAQHRIVDLRARLAREEARLPGVTSREDMTRGRVHHFKAQQAAIPRSEASRRVQLGGEIETLTKKLKREAVERAALTQRVNALREMVREADAQVPHIRADLAERERRAAEWNREQNELRGRERDRRAEQGERERVAAALAARVQEEQREQQARRREEAMDRVRRQLVLDVEAMREHLGGRFG